MKVSDYNRFTLACTQKIANLQQSEIKYHLLLLINAIKNINTDFNRNLLTGLLDFVDSLAETMSKELLSTTELKGSLENSINCYNHLIVLARIETLPTKIAHHLINIGASLSAFLLGVVSGVIGGFAGLARGMWNFTNPATTFATGLVTGMFLGAAVGFRLPKKLFKDELFRQIKFCLDNVHQCMDTMQQKKILPFAVYQERVRERLLQDYFQGNEMALSNFLQNKDVPYEVNTLKARFISPTLEGYLGHHALIKIVINQQSPPLTIEFSSTPSDLQRPVTQCDYRVVSGEKIVEMLALHEQLQITHPCTMQYIFTKMKPGENDCLSYVNKVLIGTSQKATMVQRFDGKENWVGRNVIGFFVQKLSPFRQDIFSENQSTIQVN